MSEYTAWALVQDEKLIHNTYYTKKDAIDWITNQKQFPTSKEERKMRWNEAKKNGWCVIKVNVTPVHNPNWKLTPKYV